MPSKKKRKSCLRIPQPEAVLLDRRTVVSKKQYHLAMNLLGDIQHGLIQICSAVREHRESKWPDGNINCERDALLYAVLDDVIEKYGTSRGTKSPRLKN